MSRFLVALFAIACLTVVSCGKSEEEKAAESGFELTLPGVEVRINEKDGVNVKAPDTNVRVNEDGVKVDAPGTKVRVN